MTENQNKSKKGVQGESLDSGNNEALAGDFRIDNNTITFAAENVNAISKIPSWIEGTELAASPRSINDEEIEAIISSADDNYNTYISIQGNGWKTLSNRSSTGLVALNMLATLIYKRPSPGIYRTSYGIGTDGSVNIIHIYLSSYINNI